MATELFQIKLEADDGAVNNQFGGAVSLYENLALVGTNSNNSVYLFEWQFDGTWKQHKKIPVGVTSFGKSVSLSENVFIVGTPDRLYQYWNGRNYNHYYPGGVYLFERQDDTWKQVFSYQPNVTQHNRLGCSVSVDGNVAMAGAYQYPSNNVGHVQVFEREESGWKDKGIIQAKDAKANSQFGWSVSVSGELALVGARFEDGAAGDAGAAYLFKRGDEKWEQVLKLYAEDAKASDYFGTSVSLSEDIAIVGAPNKDSDDGSAADVGAAYVFERQGDDDWIQVAKLQASDGEASNLFGSSVSIDGNFAVVGCQSKKTDAGTNAGVVYLFQRVGNGSWKEVARVEAEDPHEGDQFGISVSQYESWVLAGATYGDGKVANTGTAYLFELPRKSNIGQALTHNVVAKDGQAGDDLARSVSLSGNLAGVGAPGEGNKGGAAYIFEHSRYDFWEQVQKVVAHDREPNDDFGRSISLDGSLVAVGAPKKGEMTGAVYLFKQEGDCCAWQLVQKLMASDHEPNQYFGQSVWLDESIVMVGAPGEGEGDGAVYVFEQSDGCWEETKKLTAEDRGDNPGFGRSVSLDKNLAIVGADVDDNERPGAAYFFTREEDGSWTAGAKVQAFDSEVNDHFGHSVYLNRGLAIVGAYGKDSGASDEGAAYIYQYREGSWQRVQKIMACDRRARDQFGYSVSLNGSVAAVGAFYSNTYGNSGAVYLFQQLSNGLWVEVKKLVDHDRDVQNDFGAALSQDGELIMIGAPMQDAAPENAGAAYITQYKQQNVAPSGPTKMASGSTEAGNTNWQLNGEGNLFVQIDTSAVAFSETPKYFTTLNGDNSPEATTAVGVTSIENASKDGFQLTLVASGLTPEQANERNWHINWFAVGPDGVLSCQNS